MVVVVGRSRAQCIVFGYSPVHSLLFLVPAAGYPLASSIRANKGESKEGEEGRTETTSSLSLSLSFSLHHEMSLFFLYSLDTSREKEKERVIYIRIHRYRFEFQDFKSCFKLTLSATTTSRISPNARFRPVHARDTPRGGFTVYRPIRFFQ